MKYLHPLNLQENSKTDKEWKKTAKGFRFNTKKEDIEDFFTGLKDLGKSEVSISYTFLRGDLERGWEEFFNTPEEAIDAFYRNRNFYKEFLPGFRIAILILDLMDFYILSEQFQELEVAVSRLSENHRIKTNPVIVENFGYHQLYSFKKQLSSDLRNVDLNTCLKYEILALDSSAKKNK